MDSHYSSPSTYYYQPSCPLHDSYTDPFSPYPSHSTPSSYYYLSYIDQPSPQIVLYNNPSNNVYPQASPPTPAIRTTPALNATFELAPPMRRRRRQRTIFSKEQVDMLDQVFAKNPYPDIALREQLSQRLDVPEARIQVWFKNRRSRARTTIISKH